MPHHRSNALKKEYNKIPSLMHVYAGNFIGKSMISYNACISKSMVLKLSNQYNIQISRI